MIHHGDCLEILPTLPAESIDAIVTDPPYGLSFMGKNWDHGIPGAAFWSEALRVAKPGAHLLAFGGTRTFHRLTCAIEDAGWEIRDCIMWVYGSGFPKSHDVSKAIDREAGVQRVGGTPRVYADGTKGSWRNASSDKYAQDKYTQSATHAKLDTAPATPAAQQWQGWGTALKPAWEPVIVARKPLTGTVAQNVQAYGTGAVNVDGCRVGSDAGWSYPNGRGGSEPHHMERGERNGIHNKPCEATAGRWPANLIHDGSDEVVGLFPETTDGLRKASHADNGKSSGTYGKYIGGERTQDYGGDSGSAARFFYCAKASKADRDEGCEGIEVKRAFDGVHDNPSRMVAKNRQMDYDDRGTRRNHHPTVKPTALMRYLCRLVTPPGGTVLDPFCGSGSTGKAATLEGFDFIGIEREAEYVEIARARIAHARGDMPLLANA